MRNCDVLGVPGQGLLSPRVFGSKEFDDHPEEIDGIEVAINGGPLGLDRD